MSGNKETMEKFSDSVANVLQKKIRCHKQDCPQRYEYGPSPELPINVAKNCTNSKISRGCAGYRG